ncbi:MAG: NAD(P)/FAD-dependent oxidoreductase [Deltaproteobacteria bacterium]|nr:NAD(P)/FAD-dependent oxidoreductase [Deltaproteobacteria bacterium]
MGTDFKVVVIGAGPAGSGAAIRLLQRGVGPVLLLDRRKFPRVKPCAGGISTRASKALKDLGVYSNIEEQAYEVTGAVIVSPSGRSMHLAGDKGALVLERSRLDTLLKDAAVSEGAEFADKTMIESLQPERHGRLVVRPAGAEPISCSWVVIATGASASLAKTPLMPETLLTMTGWYKGIDFLPGTIEMFFDQELHPHYGWLFPEGAGRANIGICMDRRRLGNRNIKAVFSSFLDRHFAKRLVKAEPVRKAMGYPIAASKVTLKPKTPPGVLVVGEAARLANYFTGEGIYHALASGIYAADAIANVQTKGLPKARAAEQYFRKTKMSLGPALYAYASISGFIHPAMELLTRLHTMPGMKPFIRAALAKL